jgi:hypothetical protein
LAKSTNYEAPRYAEPIITIIIIIILDLNLTESYKMSPVEWSYLLHVLT